MKNLIAMRIVATCIAASCIVVLIIAPSQIAAKTLKHRAPRPGVTRQQQIACTVLGCQTIPAACYPKEEHSPTGIPTGFDQIVCPPGVWPF
jgi:hypothetical protein